MTAFINTTMSKKSNTKEEKNPMKINEQLTDIKVL